MDTVELPRRAAERGTATAISFRVGGTCFRVHALRCAAGYFAQARCREMESSELSPETMRALAMSPKVRPSPRDVAHREELYVHPTV